MDADFLSALERAETMVALIEPSNVTAADAMASYITKLCARSLSVDDAAAVQAFMRCRSILTLCLIHPAFVGSRAVLRQWQARLVALASPAFALDMPPSTLPHQDSGLKYSPQQLDHTATSAYGSFTGDTAPSSRFGTGARTSLGSFQANTDASGSNRSSFEDHPAPQEQLRHTFGAYPIPHVTVETEDDLVHHGYAADSQRRSMIASAQSFSIGQHAYPYPPTHSQQHAAHMHGGHPPTPQQPSFSQHRSQQSAQHHQSWRTFDSSSVDATNWRVPAPPAGFPSGDVLESSAAYAAPHSASGTSGSAAMTSKADSFDSYEFHAAGLTGAKALSEAAIQGGLLMLRSPSAPVDNTGVQPGNSNSSSTSATPTGTGPAQENSGRPRAATGKSVSGAGYGIGVGAAGLGGENSFPGFEAHLGTQDIPLWLKTLRLHKYMPLFANRTYAEMLCLTEPELERIGVSAAGARKKILLSIQKLLNREGHLADIERLLYAPEQLGTALDELKMLLSSPMQPNPGHAEGAPFDIPEKAVLLLGKTFCHVVLTDASEHNTTLLLALCDRALCHRAISTALKLKVLYWKLECDRLQLHATAGKKSTPAAAAGAGTPGDASGGQLSREGSAEEKGRARGGATSPAAGGRGFPSPSFVSTVVLAPQQQQLRGSVEEADLWNLCQSFTETASQSLSSADIQQGVCDVVCV
jgi:hypothetical protein